MQLKSRDESADEIIAGSCIWSKGERCRLRELPLEKVSCIECLAFVITEEASQKIRNEYLNQTQKQKEALLNVSLD